MLEFSFNRSRNAAVSQDISALSHPQYLKQLLTEGNETFWPELARQSKATESFSDLLLFSNLRKRACRESRIPCPPARGATIRVALTGGSTLYPLSALIEHMLFVNGVAAEMFTGDYNNFRSEMLEPGSGLCEFRPDVVIVLPDEQSCKYPGKLGDPAEMQEEAIARYSSDLLDLCASLNHRTGAEIILCNFILPPYADLGP
jgi:hypothetical protein